LGRREGVKEQMNGWYREEDGAPGERGGG
jgi:hypothetical protein